MSLIFDKSIKVKLLYSLLIVICLLALLVVFLPVGIQMAGQSWLRDQGLDANIEFVGFNLNTGTFLVENANGLNKDKRGFVLDKALLEINWKSLFTKQLDIQRFKVDGLTLDVTSTDKGLNIAGIQASEKNQQQGKEPESASDEPVSWSAQIRQIELSNIKICHDNPAVAVNDTLAVEQMMKACATLGSMKWQGKIAWSAPASKKPLTAGVTLDGDFLVEKFHYTSNDEKQHFAKLGMLSINKLQSSGLDVIKTDLVEIANVDLLQKSKNQNSPYLASWRSLKFIKPVVDQQKQNINVGIVSLSGLKANIERSKKGIAGLPVFSDNKKMAKAEKKTTSSEPFTFSVRKILIDGNSQASYTDKTVDPVFKESVSNINLSLADVDSSKPEIKSPLSASIKVSDYGEVTIQGTIRPFAERITIDLKQDIKHIDLANYNVFGKKFIGHKIHSGHMNLEQKLVIDNGKMDTTSTVVLNKFKVESLKGEEANKYKKDLGIPLSTALSLLKDSDNNIKLTIPVKGDINDPNFSLNDVITTVTGKVIKEAIINYYTPFGLVKLLGGVVGLATGLSFEPVLFEAGKADLDQQGIENLTQLAKLLGERPHVQLTFCGHPAKSDILARYKVHEVGLENGEEKKPLKLNEKQTGELLALFKTRMDNMKKYMVQKLKVSPGQVLQCSEPDNKQWTTGIEAKPGIAVSI